MKAIKESELFMLVSILETLSGKTRLEILLLVQNRLKLSTGRKQFIIDQIDREQVAPLNVNHHSGKDTLPLILELVEIMGSLFTKTRNEIYLIIQHLKLLNEEQKEILIKQQHDEIMRANLIADMDALIEISGGTYTRLEMIRIIQAKLVERRESKVPVKTEKEKMLEYIRGGSLGVLDLKNSVLRDMILCGKTKGGMSKYDEDIPDFDYSYVVFEYVKLNNAILCNADLSNTDLSVAELNNADLTNALLVGAKLTYTSLNNAKLIGADLTNAELSCTKLNNADMSGAKLINVVLTHAELKGTLLRNTNLSGGVLFKAYMRDADLTNADLTGADLSCSNLKNANLTNANLSEADLSEANLNGANLKKTNLTGVNFKGAFLYDADLTGSIGADLSGAFLREERPIPRIRGDFDEQDIREYWSELRNREEFNINSIDDTF
jgi:uncharacterized protein YjbI with pentapeptide repeats